MTVWPHQTATRRRWPAVISMVRRCVALSILAVLCLTGAACGTEVEPEVSYKPPLLPVALVIGPDGVRIEGDASIVTPMGQFSVGAKYDLPERRSGTVYVTIRDRNLGNTGFDTVYQVRTGGDEFSVVTNGTTVIAVKDGHVVIDVTDGSVQRIEFKRIEPTADESQSNPVATWWNEREADWNAGWDSSFYTPFALARWAYDDSTIDKWCGVGFVWFLVRLALAVVLAVVDMVLSVVFLLAQIAYLAGGATGRNIVWGLAVFLVIGIVVLGAAAR